LAEVNAMMLTWADFSSGATQLAVLVAATGLIYRIARLFWPAIPDAVMQVIAAVLSSVTILAVVYTPEMPRYQWLIVGISSGILLSAQVIKLLDWSSSAMTKTGAPGLGIPEQPPDWYVDLHPELFPKSTVKRTIAEAKVGVNREHKPPTFVERRETAKEMQKPTPETDQPVVVPPKEA
jgi:hypothetical protein